MCTVGLASGVVECSEASGPCPVPVCPGTRSGWQVVPISCHPVLTVCRWRRARGGKPDLWALALLWSGSPRRPGSRRHHETSPFAPPGVLKRAGGHARNTRRRACPVCRSAEKNPDPPWLDSARVLSPRLNHPRGLLSAPIRAPLVPPRANTNARPVRMVSARGSSHRRTHADLYGLRLTIVWSVYVSCNIDSIGLACIGDKRLPAASILVPAAPGHQGYETSYLLGFVASRTPMNLMVTGFPS